MSTVTFCRSLSVDWCDPRWRHREQELGALKKALVRLSYNFDKWFRDSKVPDRLNTE